MSKSLINPFELLGINEKSTAKDARKAYYQLALLCHPDCGGHEESMKVLVNAYNFVENQLKNKRDVSENIGHELEEEFRKFNIEVKAEIPKMADLYHMTKEEDKKQTDDRNFNNFNEKFNKEFENEQKYQFEELVDDPFSEGYADLMDNDKDYETEEEYVMPPKNVFKGDIQVYKEPHILPDTYGNNFRYDVKKVDDFSNYEQQEFDYVKAHTELSEMPLEIKSEMDKPIENMDILIEKYKNKRDELNVNKTQINLLLKEKDCDEEFVNV